jgi:hypothetical protein
MLTFNEFLLCEYISNPLIWFKDFINSSSDEKAEHIAHEVYENGDYFEEFIDEMGWEDYESFEDLSDTEVIEFGQWLLGNDHKIQDVLFDEELPSWWYMRDASIVKNSWLVHCSNSIPNIIHEGFQYGIEDYTKLGLTTRYSDDAKKRYKDEDFYLFSYTPLDFKKYGYGYRGLKYGDEFVVFRSSGVRVYHNSDDEYQTIFSAREARDFVPVFERNGNYVVEDKVSGKIIFENENPNKVVGWVIANFDQYKTKICQRYKN